MMVWTREEVDKYVAKVEKNIGNATEKNLKGFAFARLYREAREMDKAKTHLEAYISVNEGDFRGHRLMGQILEETGNLKKALSFYRRSLELDNTQNDLVLKVVELYCSVPVHPERAKAWADRAARLFPGHPAVFRLRMHLLESTGKPDYEEMEDLITSEMAKRPKAVDLHIRLVKLYSSSGRLADAFAHCVSVTKTKAFEGSLEWWTCVVEITGKYMSVLDKSVKTSQEVGSAHVILEAHIHLLLALSYVTCLQLTQSETSDCISSLYRFDHCLFAAFKRRIKGTPRTSKASIKHNEWQVVLQEMRGQLYMHLGTLIMKLAKEHYVTWSRASKLSTVCYMISLEIAEPNMQTPWVAEEPDNKNALRWYSLACARRSHIGHFLMAIRNRHGQDWLDQTLTDCCSPQGHADIVTTVYQHRRDLALSYLAEDSSSFNLTIKIPSHEELVTYDEVAICEQPCNLQLITWIGLHWYQYEKTMRPGVGVVVDHLFDGLRMDLPNIEQTHADLLCLRDLEAFIYAVVRTAAARLLDDKDVYYEDFQPRILPYPLCSQLSFNVQDEWWSAAYKLYSGTTGLHQSGKVRAKVQRGIEVIRALGNHGLHVKLLLYLAHTFADKATYLKTADKSPWYYEEHWKSLQARSIHYWKQSLKLLEKIERNESVSIPRDPLFPQLQDDLLETEITNNLQVARLNIGEAAVREGDYEEAMKLYEQVKTFQGIWNLAQIYKYLASVEAQAASEEIETGNDVLCPPTQPSQEYYNCLGKARELLVSCLDNITVDQKNQQNLKEEIANLEDLLNDDHVRPITRKQLEIGRLDHQPSYCSTVLSDAQESEDNFWVEQPQDSSTKDLIAKLSEVTLNNGYLQEKMTERDQQMADMSEEIQYLKREIMELKRCERMSGGRESTPERSFRRDVPHGHLESTPASKLFNRLEFANGQSDDDLSADDTLGTMPDDVKIDPSFFAGLSKTNVPKNENTSDEERERLESTGDDIYFEPVIPLPAKVEVRTGEENEDVVFSERAKLFRFDKDYGAWKERGVGVIKILRHQKTNQARILMRRDHVHKICTNHFITPQMELKPKQGSKNTWVYTTMADFADEVSKIEQLAVKFKSPSDADLFQKEFMECQKLETVQQTALTREQPSSTKPQQDLSAKFTPKSGSWSCAVYCISNEQKTTVCAACGANKLDDTTSPVTSRAHSTFKMLPPGESIPDLQVSKADTAFTTPPPVSRSTIVPPFGGTAPSFTFQDNSQDFVDETKLSPQEESTSVFGGKNEGMPEKQPLTFGGMTGTAPETDLLKPKVTDTSTQTPPHKCEKCDSASGEDINTPSGTFILPRAGTSTAVSPFSLQQTAAAVASPFTSQSVDAQRLFWQQPQFAPSGFAARPAQFGIPADKAQQNLWYPAAFALRQMAQQPTVTQSSSLTTPSFTASQIERPFTLNPQSMKSSPFVPGEVQTGGYVQKVAWYSPSTSATQLGTTKSFDFKPYTVEEPSPQKIPDSTAPQLPALLQQSTVTVEECHSDEYNGDFDQEENSVKSEYETESKTESDATASSEESDSIPLSRPQPERPQRPDPEMVSTFPVSIVTPAELIQTKERVVQKDNAPVLQQSPITGRRIIRARVPVRQDFYAIIFEAKPNKADREKASKLLLPPNFYNYKKFPPCSGCRGCSDKVKLAPETATTTETATALLPHKTSEDLPAGVFGKAFGGEALSFTDFAKQAGVGTFVKKEGNIFSGFPRQGTQLFAEEESVEESGDGIYFEPLVPLPDEVDSVTGEEEEEVMFCERAKLYRFDSKSSQWKERGIGNIKLLTNPEKGRSRVVMRREQVLKVCANHCINQEMELKPGLGSECSWVWHAASDFAEGAPTPELFAVKFKSKDIAVHFQEVFDSLKERSEGADGIKVVNKSNEELLQSRFELPPGSWWCDLCFLVNDSDKSFCVACKTAKSGVSQSEATELSSQPTRQQNQQTFAKPVSSSINPVKPGSTFTFGVQPSLADKTKPEDAQPKLTTSKEMNAFDAVKGSAAETTPALVSLLTENNADRHESFKPSPKQPPSISQASVFVFGSGNSPLFTIGQGESVRQSDGDDDANFEKMTPSKISSPPRLITEPSPVKQSTTSLPENIPSDIPFGRDLPVSFTFSYKPSPVASDRKPNAPKTPEESVIASSVSPEEPHPETEDDGIHFEPIIPLPEKIVVRTGEEREQTVFCQRAKLYRYDKDSSQWKERGLGDFKILYDPETKRYRVLMRREHVLKICANHIITADMNLKPNAGSEKCWVWSTLADFADEMPKPETLAIRFKTKEISQEFLKKFKDAQETRLAEKESLNKEKDKPYLSTGKLEETRESIKESEGECSESTGSKVYGRSQDWSFESQHPGNNKDKSDDRISILGTSKREGDAKDERQPQVSPVDVNENQSKPAASAFLFGSADITSLSFTAVADTLNSSPFSKKTPENSPKTKSPKFPRARRFSENEDGDDPEKECDGIHFEPLIPLPEKIEVKTGEENEEILFSQRAKLYRYDKPTKQWKERGVGDIKLLHHRHKNQVRVLMRRDQVHKICANHFVTADMELKPLAGSSKSWVWNTLADFADEQAKPEQLAVRFKSTETANEFKEKFDHCLKLSEQKVDSCQNEEYNKTEAGNVLAKFQPKPGSWDCEVCLVNNPSDNMVCAACKTTKPGAKATQSKTVGFGDVILSVKPSKQEVAFCFKIPQETDENTQRDSVPQKQVQDIFSKFKPKPGSWECQSCLVRNGANETACEACGTKNTATEVASVPETLNKKSQFQCFATTPSSAGLSFTFGTIPKESTQPEKPTFQFGSNATSGPTVKAATSFTFGASPPNQDSNLNSGAGKAFTFGAIPVKGGVEKSNGATKEASTSTVKSGSLSVKADTSFTFGAAPPNKDSNTSSGTGKEFTFGAMPDRGEVEKPDKLNEEVLTSTVKSGSPKVEDALEKYKPKLGSWECDSCLIRNDAGKSVCAACGTERPGATATLMKPGLTTEPKKFTFSLGSNVTNEPTVKADTSFTFGAVPPNKDSNSSSGAGKAFTFGAMPVRGEMEKRDKVNEEGLTSTVKSGSPSMGDILEKYKPQLGSWECDSCLIRNDASKSVCAACGNEKPGATATSVKPALPAEISKSGFVPSTTGKGFTFKAPEKSSGPQTTTPVFSFEAPFGMPASAGSGDIQTTAAPTFTFGQALEMPVPLESSELQTTPTFTFGGPLGMPAPRSSQGSPQKRDNFSLTGLKSNGIGGEANAANKIAEAEKIEASIEMQKQVNFSRAEAITDINDKRDGKNVAAEVYTETEDKESLGKEEVSETTIKPTDKETQVNIELVEKSVMTDSTNNTVSLKKTEEASTEELLTSGAENMPAVKDKDDEVVFVTALEPTSEEIRRAERLLLPTGFFLFEREPEKQPQFIEELSSTESSTLTSTKAKGDDSSAQLQEEEVSSKVVGEASSKGHVFGAGKPESFLSFAKMASSANEGAFSKSSSQGFTGQGSHLFGSYLNEEHDPEQEDDIQFQPVIPLPERVHVVSGEEDETVLFSNRAKMYRYDKNTSQWKERGVGEIKILRHQKTKKPRILMRREQVHKICANHFITEDMQLTPNSASDRSWVWQTLADFSDEVQKTEQLAVRFKTVGMAEEFKSVFEECQQDLSKVPPVDDITAINAQEPTAEDEQGSKNQEITKYPAKISGNESLNDVDARMEPAVTSELKKDDESAEESSSKEPQTSRSSSSDQRGGNTTEDGLSNKGKEDQKQSGKFLFGSPNVSSLSFEDIAKRSPSGSDLFSGTSKSKLRPFAGVGAQLFQSPAHEDRGDEETGAHDESGDHIYFEPIIPLPEKVVVKTGEENEEVVFKERCKLYRFESVTKQWKERGVGDIKLLQEPNTRKARVVMRREQIHKLCANHLITSDMELGPNAGSEKSWVWHTMADMSEGEPRAEQLAVKFKSPQIAQEFKVKFNSLKEDVGRRSMETSLNSQMVSQSNSGESKVSTESPVNDEDKKIKPLSPQTTQLVTSNINTTVSKVTGGENDNQEQNKTPSPGEVKYDTPSQQFRSSEAEKETFEPADQYRGASGDDSSSKQSEKALHKPSPGEPRDDTTSQQLPSSEGEKETLEPADQYRGASGDDSSSKQSEKALDKPSPGEAKDDTTSQQLPSSEGEKETLEPADQYRGASGDDSSSKQSEKALDKPSPGEPRDDTTSQQLPSSEGEKETLEPADQYRGASGDDSSSKQREKALDKPSRGEAKDDTTSQQLPSSEGEKETLEPADQYRGASGDDSSSKQSEKALDKPSPGEAKDDTTSQQLPSSEGEKETLEPADQYRGASGDDSSSKQREKALDKPSPGEAKDDTTSQQLPSSEGEKETLEPADQYRGASGDDSSSKQREKALDKPSLGEAKDDTTSQQLPSSEGEKETLEPADQYRGASGDDSSSKQSEKALDKPSPGEAKDDTTSQQLPSSEGEKETLEPADQYRGASGDDSSSKQSKKALDKPSPGEPKDDTTSQQPPSSEGEKETLEPADQYRGASGDDSSSKQSEKALDKPSPGEAKDDTTSQQLPSSEGEKETLEPADQYRGASGDDSSSKQSEKALDKPSPGEAKDDTTSQQLPSSEGEKETLEPADQYRGASGDDSSSKQREKALDKPSPGEAKDDTTSQQLPSSEGEKETLEPADQYRGASGDDSSSKQSEKALDKPSPGEAKDDTTSQQLPSSEGEKETLEPADQYRGASGDDSSLKQSEKALDKPSPGEPKDDTTSQQPPSSEGEKETLEPADQYRGASGDDSSSKQSEKALDKPSPGEAKDDTTSQQLPSSEGEKETLEPADQNRGSFGDESSSKQGQKALVKPQPSNVSSFSEAFHTTSTKEHSQSLSVGETGISSVRQFQSSSSVTQTRVVHHQIKSVRQVQVLQSTESDPNSHGVFSAGVEDVASHSTPHTLELSRVLAPSLDRIQDLGSHDPGMTLVQPIQLSEDARVSQFQTEKKVLESKQAHIAQRVSTHKQESFESKSVRMVQNYQSVENVQKIRTQISDDATTTKTQLPSCSPEITKMLEEIGSASETSKNESKP